MPEFPVPEEAAALAADAIRREMRASRDIDPEDIARVALEAAAPVLAQAWGVKPDDELRALFADLKAEWLKATAVESSAQRIAFDRSYQRIIGLGPHVIPLILEDIADAQPRLVPHWFWALTMLTGEDQAAGAATVPGAAAKWLTWGRAQGLILEVPGAS